MAIERERDGPHRSSTENSRRTMTLERESEQNNRDYSSRLMQKLDIHRKTNTNPPSQGGIASLITASQNLLPIGMPMAPLATMDSETLRSRNSMYMPSELPPSTFAPTTLVNPPAPTSMSRAAVIVSAERGITLKAADGAGHIPQGMMANLWGSQNWALLNKVQRRRHTDDGKPGQRRTPSSDRLGLKDSGQPRSRSRHKQTMSLTNNFQTFEEVPQESYEYPSCYPQALKTQDAQFRLLFPNVPRDE
ncbi:SNF1-interacting protein, partial [Ascosphaera atra]